MKKNGFTLIELLAVIIILGILMIIAIPSVTKYISDSRKSSYIGTAKEIISSARNLVNSGDLEMFDTDTSYYINQECIKTENGTKSPYGEFTKAYVVVNYDGKGYEYYWTSVDDAGEGIKSITKVDNLDGNLIQSDLSDSDISNTLGVDGRNKYMIIDKNTNCGKGTVNQVSGNISGEGNNQETPTISAQALTTTVSQTDLVNIPDTDIYIYRGANPPNYVKFNCNGDSCEIWRIIGIYGNQLKVIRPQSPKNTAYNPGDYPANNNWINSTIDNYLNQNTEGGYYYSLSTSAKEMIDEREWNVGKVRNGPYAITAYTDAVQNKYVTKIGTMSYYESGYASAEQKCQNMYSLTHNGYGCLKRDINWLSFGTRCWTMSAWSDSDSYVWIITSTGESDHLFVSNPLAVYPAAFLKSSVKIAGGSGTSDDPYTLK